jgi:hypothetical protein
MHRKTWYERFMPESSKNIFSLSMSRKVQLAFYFLIALSAGITAWSFSSGFMWTGICLIAVGAPMGLLFWYMLHVNPSRAFILLNKNSIIISAVPFVEETIPIDQIRRISPVRLKKGDTLFPVKTVRGMRFASYRTGIFTLKNGAQAIIAANSSQVLAVETDATLYLIGPDERKRLEQHLSQQLA